jgi:hypothetical protein
MGPPRPTSQPRPHRGRPPRDLRRTWDAIFWVACSRLPWHCLPPGLGRHDSAHRALRRAARAGLIDRLLIAVADHPGRGGWDALRWRVARACRRVARLLSFGQLALAERLGLRDALPCEPVHLPRPHLSGSLLAQAELLRCPAAVTDSLLRYLRTLHRLVEGNRRAWRLTA